MVVLQTQLRQVQSIFTARYSSPCLQEMYHLCWAKALGPSNFLIDFKEEGFSEDRTVSFVPRGRSD